MSDYIIWGLCLVMILGQGLPLDWFRRLEDSSIRQNQYSRDRRARQTRKPKFQRRR